ncbi:MAG: phage protease [Planctomycetota bacterium]
MQETSNVLKRDDRPGVDRVALEASALGESAVPTRVLIAPWGAVESSSGSFVVDEEAARATIAAFESHKTDLPVDYEHQTLGGAYSSPTGQAPAAGWIKALSVALPAESGEQAAGGHATGEQMPRERVAGLWADVEWTEDAESKLGAREYRYLSPVALVRRSDRRLVGIHSVALTNKPAIVGMKPVVNSANADAPATNSEASSNTDATESIPATVALRTALSLDESANDDVVLVAAAERICALEQAEKLRTADERVSRAMSAGKLTHNQKDWALSLAQRDPDEYDRWECEAPVVVPLGRIAAPDAGESAHSSARSRSIEAAATAEWQANRAALEKLCSQEAYVANALRECGS